uniref:Insulin-like domain-containing protein n=1 Tax=Esox lucius TaxID=8010 RepID=A0A3P8XG55_ESOLU
MKSQLLSLLLLFMLCTQEVQTEDEATVTALRLCETKLLRAVVYTCGGSRWRRHPVEDVDGQKGGPQWQRDLSQALARMCCQLGCQKSDLPTMC